MSSCLPFNVYNVQSNVIYYIFTHTVVLVILNVVHFVSDHCRQCCGTVFGDSGEWALHIVVLTVSDDIPAFSLWVCDTAVTKVPKTNILSATLLLLVSHYIFDLEYSRFYANLLGVLQTLTIMWRTPASSSNFSLRNCVLLFKVCRSHYPRLTTSYPVTLTKS